MGYGTWRCVYSLISCLDETRLAKERQRVQDQQQRELEQQREHLLQNLQETWLAAIEEFLATPELLHCVAKVMPDDFIKEVIEPAAGESILREPLMAVVGTVITCVNRESTAPEEAYVELALDGNWPLAKCVMIEAEVIRLRGGKVYLTAKGRKTAERLERKINEIDLRRQHASCD